MSCAFFHIPPHAFSGTTSLSFGVDGQPTGRHTPTLINRDWGKSEFWDGRSSTSEAQAIIPVTNSHVSQLTVLSQSFPSLGATHRCLQPRWAIRNSRSPALPRR
ncbi:MAG: hypothetical protein M3Y57_19285 [Acidobacteriota bacterium]|nr:hypothetical protein [Acidobacteriota bacterium]